MSASERMDVDIDDDITREPEPLRDAGTLAPCPACAACSACGGTGLVPKAMPE